MNTRFAVTAWFLALSMLASAQVTVKRYSVDDNASRSKSARNSRNAERYSTALKYNLAPFFSGHYPLSIEQRFSPFFTAEVGLGLTTHNTVDAGFAEILYWDNDFYSTQAKSRLGGSQHLNVKIFPSGDAFNDGFYFGVFVQNRQYNRLFRGFDMNFTSFKRNVDQGLIFGYHVRSSDRLMVDLSIGVSNRNVYFPTVQENYIYDPVSQQEVYLFNQGDPENSYQTIGLIGGLKISYLMGSAR